MSLLNDEQSSYYEILDLKPEASPQEIREAYLRTKGTYNKDSVALYTLISPAEREDMLRKIEEAYTVLSNSEKRKEYDRNHGLIDTRNDFRPAVRPRDKIVSIDRVPPMDSDGDDLLVPPSTDFGGASEAPAGPRSEVLQSPAMDTLMGDAPPARSSRSPFEEEAPEAPLPPVRAPAVAQASVAVPAQPTAQAAPPVAATATATAPAPAAAAAPIQASPAPAPQPPAFIAAAAASAAAAPRAPTGDSLGALMREIEAETEWKGGFLRRIREARRISLEEMSATTKISKTYILAVEEDNYTKLPAPVYIRGFVTQIARVLKLPHGQVAAAYMNRYTANAPQKH